MTNHCSPDNSVLPPWEDADVQLVYKMLCDPDLNELPNREEHWEGWISRNIVAALRASVAQSIGPPRRMHDSSTGDSFLECPGCGAQWEPAPLSSTQGNDVEKIDGGQS